jgi:DNA-directed RNA polymerase subunit L
MSELNIKQIKKQSFNKLKHSLLHLNLSGKNINYVIVNTLRRGALELVPTYAFIEESINIEENTSVFDNDELKNRLAQIPIFNVKPSVVLLEEKYWKNVNFDDPDREKHKDDTMELELYINKTNTSKDLLPITSKDFVFYENTKVVDKFKHIEPLLLFKLRPNEVFKCRLSGVLGIGKRNDIFSAVSNCYFEEINPKNEEEPHNYNLYIESMGQLDEYEILIRVCKIIQQNLKETVENIKQAYKNESVETSDYIVLEFLNITHTIGNLINDSLQNNPLVKFSGYAKPDQLEDRIIIKLLTTNNKPLEVLYSTVDQIIKDFDKLSNVIKKLYK